MNPIHRKIIKAASLRDKEGEHRLVALYYDTPAEERVELLNAMLAESKRTAAKLKELELTKLEEEERTIGAIVDAAEEARTEKEAGETEEGGDGIVRGEGSGGDDQPPGVDVDSERPGSASVPDAPPRLQLP